MLDYARCCAFFMRQQLRDQSLVDESLSVNVVQDDFQTMIQMPAERCREVHAWKDLQPALTGLT